MRTESRFSIFLREDWNNFSAATERVALPTGWVARRTFFASRVNNQVPDPTILSKTADSYHMPKLQLHNNLSSISPVVTRDPCMDPPHTITGTSTSTMAAVYPGQLMSGPPTAQGLSPCGCPQMPVGHWCGHPQPCCIARHRTRWPGAKNLNHLPICHESCWRRDAIAIPQRLRAEGRNVFGDEDPTNLGGHLRLCHRRCYVQDLMRNLEHPDSEESEEWRRREIVPCNQTLLEMLWFPSLQHWVVRRLAVAWLGSKWQRPRHDQPWPLWLGEKEILGLESEKEQEKWMARRAVEEEGKAASAGEKERVGLWYFVTRLWPFSRRM